MSCYLRHLKDLFVALGLEYDKANRQVVDAAIRQVLNLSPGKICPQVWAAIKDLSESERRRLTVRLAAILP
ncbi:MAG: hypothetical protein C0616_15120 [Desulfuromonas sp.]|nr:MAG: hypothetical protein C0616_15120 [Desulfuromonas sp.]